MSATHSDIIAQIEHAIADRASKRGGNETRFRCPHPDKHRNGDEHPSARWNPVKAVWRCDVCGAGGGYMSLAQGLGVGTNGDNGYLIGAIDRPYGYSPRSERTGPDREKLASARRLWFAARHATGTVVQGYLRSRGITVQIPPTIRFLAAAWHTRARAHFPVMIGAVQDCTGRLIGVHRTFLAKDGQGKAFVEPVKMMLGQCAGGALRLARAGSVLAVTEGIETGLSVLEATGLPTWAGLSAGGIAALALPALPLAAQVTVFADHDRAGIDAAERAALRWHHQGRSVRLALPPTPGRDFNDLLRGVA